ncbi:3',5'-cyclic-AMP phosphodiesterase [Kangiella sp. TOML190]|uniref:3',5'-cyclic-AMP phosphodiesterase n=1 Tax=Kangiella sp. TOML190 TaxID=2931351 RepID=UPI00203C9956|nr:3',5'-cyclic-AMP phosphodiesterase [Kangiella sp. TOML190]
MTTAFLHSASATFNLIQISDPHLFADPEGCLLGVNTRQSFLAILGLIQQQESSIDAIVVTGDISQDYSVESYQFFAQQMEQFACPVLCLAGNHDEQELLEQILSQKNISTQKQFSSSYWQLLLAHSQVKGEVFGYIDETEMQWLAQQVASEQKPTLVFTHHHPVYSKTDWIDVLGIKNCEAFTEFLASQQQIKACGFGHIHQELHITQGGVDYYGVPSTCIQFKKEATEFAVSEEMPGYRRFCCYPNGRFETQVERLQEFELSLDHAAGGY